ncbi:MAG: Gldg family protein [Bryobacterales bacterium]|nr:Gldg family protein [Bryobacteraceae bacterium]MDW8354003.1 Gldg family protein [Bryobacterales bacterium]
MNVRTWRVIAAIARRELTSYFSTPTGYVFITLFVFLSAVAAFWQEQFFASNLANLEQLNKFFPYLLLFLAPAISMSLWSEEKKQGTEELLLTLPARDGEIVLGKYVAALAIYSVALAFSVSHVVVLAWLGSPDPGLMVSTYFGYWLAGAALIALGMLASLLAENLTVAFLLGAVFCAVPIFLNRAGVLLTGSWQRLAERLSVPEQLRDLLAGVVTPAPIVYFVTLALASLYLNVLLLGRKRWPEGAQAPRMGRHVLVRGLSLAVILGAATTLAATARVRIDVTAEKIHTLAADTVALLRRLDPSQPVFIHAYFSPEVPRSYVGVRNNLVAMLREFDAVGGEALHVRVYETLKYSPEARQAQERFGIRPHRVPVTEESARVINEIFLGLAFTCGAEEFVIPFFDRGLPVEYELMRSVRVVSRAQRKKVGVLATKVRLFGGFDFQTRVQRPEWSIVSELRKQYDVVEVPAEADYPQDLDALIVAQPSTLSQPGLERLVSYLRAGRPALILLDPMPAFDLNLAPNDIVATDGILAPPTAPEPRANLTPLLELLGIEWRSNRIAWDDYNPHPQLRTLPKEIVFVKQFNPQDAVTAGLQEVVLLYPGALTARAGAPVTPLLETTPSSGLVRWESLVQRSLFGITINQNLRRDPDPARHVLAVRVRGRVSGGRVHAIVAADIDLMGEQFFELRRRGVEELNFDNVTFLLNAVDDLAGDPAFIALRKRRPRHRTLEAVEARTQVYEARRREQIRQAEAVAEQRLKEAQARLDRAVEEIRRRTDVDEQTRQIMIRNVEAVENRRLAVARANIEDEKQRQIEAARAEMENSVRAIQNTIKLLAVALPPLPAFFMFLVVSVRRLRRERAMAGRLVET